MIEWFASHNGIEQLFLLSGIVGAVILIFRMILMIAGIDHHGTDVHSDNEHDFKALTIQGVASFFSMFGVVGFLLYHSVAIGMLIALIGAFGAGAFSMWLMHRIYRSVMRLQSSGTVNIFAAVGSEGLVYLTVSKEGGRVQISFANRLREFEAISADGTTIPTGTPIRVQNVEANTLIVAPVER
jgi:membrane protein implicated in regulation of membrane protease activity